MAVSDDSSKKSRQVIDPLPEDGGVLDWTSWSFNNLPLLVILGLVYAVLWVISKGPFFPPFGGSK